MLTKIVYDKYWNTDEVDKAYSGEEAKKGHMKNFNFAFYNYVFSVGKHRIKKRRCFFKFYNNFLKLTVPMDSIQFHLIYQVSFFCSFFFFYDEDRRILKNLGPSVLASVTLVNFSEFSTFFYFSMRMNGNWKHWDPLTFWVFIDAFKVNFCHFYIFSRIFQYFAYY